MRYLPRNINVEDFFDSILALTTIHQRRVILCFSWLHKIRMWSNHKITMISQLTNSAPSSIAFFSALSTSADYERRNYGNEVLGIAIP